MLFAPMKYLKMPANTRILTPKIKYPVRGDTCAGGIAAIRLYMVVSPFVFCRRLFSFKTLS